MKYIIVNVGNGAIVASGLDYAEASTKASELCWNSKQRYVVCEEEDYNLRLEKEDVL